jgi:2-polyprenyl-3-methyl-5-hydroxy-6-metoxy-1,4-benzoquinol methylase
MKKDYKKLSDINELTRQAYNATADKYHQLFKNEINEKAYDRNILDKFSAMIPENSLICDAGCGPSGHIGKYLFNKGHRIVGVDISDRCIEIAKQHEPDMHFERMDMGDMDFDNGYFDAIVSYYSIIYTPKEKVGVLFESFQKKLKPGGKLLVAVKKGDTEGFLKDDEWYKTTVYFSYFSEEDIKGYFTNNGFGIEFLETREPYDFEIKVERIYGIGTKLE